MRLLTLVITTLALAAAFCAPASAITGGVPDGDAHPAVGLLGFDLDGTGPMPPVGICAGTVISDRAVLTARHCIEPPLLPLPPGVQWAFTLEPGSPEDPIEPGGLFPDEFPGCCLITVPERRLARPVSIALHPGYGSGFVPGVTAPTLGENDVAVLLFAPGTFAEVRPVRIVREGGLDHLDRGSSRRRGPVFTVVGYGLEATPAGLSAPGYRKAARARFARLLPDWLVLTNTPDAHPRAGAQCYGDSGGPVFRGGSGVQVALHHVSDPVCTGLSFNQRLDVPSVQAFLAPYLRDR